MHKRLLGIIFSLIGLQFQIYADFSQTLLAKCDMYDEACEKKIYKQYTISKTKACSLEDGEYVFPLQASRPNAEVKVYSFSKSSYKKKKILAYVVHVTYNNYSQETYLYTYDCLSKKPLQVGTFSSFGQKEDAGYIGIIGFTYPNIILDFGGEDDWEAKTLSKSISSYFQNKGIYNLDNNRYYPQDISQYKGYTSLEEKIKKELNIIYENRKKEDPNFDSKVGEIFLSPIQSVLNSLGNGTNLIIENYRGGRANISLQGTCDWGIQCGDIIGKARIDFLKKTITL